MPADVFEGLLIAGRLGRGDGLCWLLGAEQHHIARLVVADGSTPWQLASPTTGVGAFVDPLFSVRPPLTFHRATLMLLWLGPQTACPERVAAETAG
jgi:hypothetical protein